MEKRKPDVAQICQTIWQSIVEKKLRPGTRLKEEQLSEVFGVSRARVRQVLAVLQRDGLVSIIPNRGAFVSEPDADEARDVFYLRTKIEERVVERLVERISEQDINRLEGHLKKELAAQAKGDRLASVKLSGEFHMLLATLAESTLLHGILQALVVRSSLVTVMYRREEMHDCGPDEHRELIDIIRSGDKKGALQCMQTHLKHIEDELDLSQNDVSSRDLWQVFK
ncbi:GntR family transcriptional regulator [Oceaniovalibus sp. ACAM 378]|uniref:GntR family transcriptional regulator n=1 Tax=Oceaniovalibus sp. ACAM 378 TaxID=2599923 RepID=UPI0011D44398|nr:GntR family transcriptional regulator [Oceaniovalibus sp. ACAM 378]TYB83759.1 GntR family transcriptional regulator [Oceaniovalibus sp. ACAM 378]